MIMVLFSVFFLLAQEAHVLVLNNGKTIQLPGPYRVEGSFVRYQDAAGQLFQLPLNLVDLEKSESLKQALASKAEEKAQQSPKKPVVDKPNLTQIAMELQGEMTEEDRQKVSSQGVLDNQGAKKYRQTVQNSYVTDTAQPGVSAEDWRQNKGQFKENMDQLAGELEKLDGEIRQLQETMNHLENSAAYNDDPTGASFRSLEDYEKRLAQKQKERDSKFQEWQKVQRSARNQGYRKLAGKHKVNKQSPQDQSKDRLDYEETKGEFDYEEE
jgi:hypothetical protein